MNGCARCGDLQTALRLARMAIEQGQSIDGRIAANGPTIGQVIDAAIATAEGDKASTAQKRTPMQIVTDYVYPPIPDRRFDWRAYVAGDEEAGRYGEGRTEQAAIDDLLASYCRERSDQCTPNGDCLICVAAQGEKCRATTAKNVIRETLAKSEGR